MFIRLYSILDSLELPFGRIPVPWIQVASGKLKSPAKIISGVGESSALRVFSIFSITILLKEFSRWAPLYLSFVVWSSGGR